MARPIARGLLAIMLVLLAAGPARAATSSLPIEDLARRYGLTASWIKPGRELRLKSPWTTLDFTAGSREAAWNGYRLFLGDPVQVKKRTLHLTATDWKAIVRPLLDAKAVSPPAGGRLELIVIDPGHGGNDPGTENRKLGLKEKIFTLDVAQRLRRDLEKRGYKVVMTRTTDTRLKPTQSADLRARAEVAKRRGADLYISIHFNALPNNARVRGIETYSLTPAGQRSTAASRRSAGDRVVQPGNRFDHWSAVLGAALHHSLIGRLGTTDRGIKRARFAVLRPISCPAVLVEAGFLTNPEEAKKINTAVYRQQIAEAIGAGVGLYHTRLREAGKG